MENLILLKEALTNARKILENQGVKKEWWKEHENPSIENFYRIDCGSYTTHNIEINLIYNNYKKQLEITGIIITNNPVYFKELNNRGYKLIKVTPDGKLRQYEYYCHNTTDINLKHIILLMHQQKTPLSNDTLEDGEELDLLISDLENSTINGEKGVKPEWCKQVQAGVPRYVDVVYKNKNIIIYSSNGDGIIYYTGVVTTDDPTIKEKFLNKGIKGEKTPENQYQYRYCCKSSEDPFLRYIISLMY